MNLLKGYFNTFPDQSIKIFFAKYFCMSRICQLKKKKIMIVLMMLFSGKDKMFWQSDGKN